MSHAWFLRETPPTHAWASRLGNEGIISGDATVQASVERDLVFVWTVHAGVESDLALIWQVDASPITAVESDLVLSWDILVDATGYVETDLELLWQNHGSVDISLTLIWDLLLFVPNVVPMSESSARFLLQEAGFVVTTTTSSSPYIAFGDVISTYPAGGEPVEYGSDVLMVVSIGTQAPGEHGAGFPVNWQGKRKKLKLVQQPNKHLKKLLDATGRQVLKTKPKKPKLKVKAIKLW